MSAASESTPQDPFLEILAADDPHPGIHKLRAEDPVHFVEPLGFWLVTRHDDVKRLFNDPQNASIDRRNWEHHVPEPEGSFMRWAEERSLLALSSQEHARIRRLVSAAFTPRARYGGSRCRFAK